MIYGLFMLLDALTAVTLLLAQFGFIKWQIVLYHASYLILKGGWYWKAWASWIDIAAGLWLLAMLLGAQGVITYFFIGWIAYKFLLHLMYS